MKLIKQNLPEIERLFADSGKTDVIYFDDTIKRFGLRLRASGHRSWVVQYEFYGRSKRVTLGNAAVLEPDQARHLARQELAKVELGADVSADKAKEKASAKLLLGAVIKQYLEAKRPGLRTTTFAEISRYLNKTWRELHPLPISKVERGHVASILRAVAIKTPVAAAQARSCLSTFYAWAIREDFCDNNPVINTNDPHPHITRDRVLTNQELVAIWNACADASDYSRIVRLLILTGARRDEIGGMEWRELDHDAGTWTLPASRAKNGRQHILPLPQLAWQIIKAIDGGPRVHVFGGRGKHGFANWHVAKQALDQASGVTGWTIHDLRRSAATKMAEIGILPHIVEAILNHIGHRAGVQGIYNRATYLREIRTALITWADHITSITTATERKIIPISRASGNGEPAA